MQPGSLDGELGQAAVLNHVVITQAKPSRRRHDVRCPISKIVDEAVYINEGLNLYPFRTLQEMGLLRMRVENKQHRHGRGHLELQIKAYLDQHNEYICRERMGWLARDSIRSRRRCRFPPYSLTAENIGNQVPRAQFAQQQGGLHR